MSHQPNDKKTVCTCNKLFDKKTLHPLVSVISLNKDCSKIIIDTDCYSVMLFHHSYCECCYGHKDCDFSHSTVIFRSPDKSIPLPPNCSSEVGGTLLVFHPTLMQCSSLQQTIRDFTFFRYSCDEALHLSVAETHIVERCFDDIDTELQWGVDKFSATLICNKIEMLLNYCNRFYARQFITRHDANQRMMTDITRMTDEHFANGTMVKEGNPCACKFARKLNMSAAYFNDLVKSETGKDFSNFAQLRRIAIAKQMIISASKSDEEIATTLGFCSASCFRTLFEKLTGTTTNEYRT